MNESVPDRDSLGIKSFVYAGIHETRIKFHQQGEMLVMVASLLEVFWHQLNVDKVVVLLLFVLGCGQSWEMKETVGEHREISFRFSPTPGCSNGSRQTLLMISTTELSAKTIRYMNFRQEPFLSKGISIVSRFDTIHPMMTILEKGYDLGSEMTYMCAFDCVEYEKISNGTFFFANFLGIGDTLQIPLEQ